MWWLKKQRERCLESSVVQRRKFSLKNLFIVTALSGNSRLEGSRCLLYLKSKKSKFLPEGGQIREVCMHLLFCQLEENVKLQKIRLRYNNLKWSHSELLPFMLGSGFLTVVMGELPDTVVWPARPAGRGDPEAVRPGDSCKRQIRWRPQSQLKCTTVYSKYKNSKWIHL